MISLEGKTGVVMGVANHRSIAWGIARAVSDAGARIALSYQGERLERTVRKLSEDLKDPLVHPCDVTDDAQVDEFFQNVGEAFGGLDFLVHAIAFAPREDLEGRFVDTSRQGFSTALDVSAYSLASISRRAAPLMERRGGGSIVTLTYVGGARVVTNYNVMGVAKAALESSVRYLASELGPAAIRVNAISAGPIKTLAARGISGFMSMLEAHAAKAPLRRNVEVEEVADTALFLISPLSRGITGEVLFVDAGHHIMGV